MRLKWVYNMEDMRKQAKRRLPKLFFDFIDGGVLDEFTINANEKDMRSIMFHPVALAEIPKLDTSTTVFGTEMKFPLMVSPMGMLTMFHPEADKAIAREVMKFGSIFIHSHLSGISLEDTVRCAEPQRVWAQMALRSDEETQAYLKRLRVLGIDTIVVKTDTIASDKRERDLHNGLKTQPPKPPISGLLNFGRHPGWVYRWLTGPPLTPADHTINGRPIKMHEMRAWMRNEGKQPTWSEVKALRDQWDGNLVLKGISTPESALKAIEVGADGVFVSNLGGRQFDGQRSAISALPDVVRTLNGAENNIEIFFDSGIRRGHDAVRAIALGAKAVAAGRVFAYSLSAYGQKGVGRMFEILHDEFSTAMKGIGVGTVGEIDRSVISPRSLATIEATDLDFHLPPREPLVPFHSHIRGG